MKVYTCISLHRIWLQKLKHTVNTVFGGWRTWMSGFHLAVVCRGEVVDWLVGDETSSQIEI